MRAARAFNWLIEWPCERVQHLHGSIIWIYWDCKDTRRHLRPQWIVCRVVIKYATFQALKTADKTVRVWAWIICIWCLWKKSKLQRFKWFFPTTRYWMLDHRNGTPDKLQNVTRYFFPTLPIWHGRLLYVCFTTLLIQCQFSHDAHTWPLITHGDSEKNHFLLSNRHVALHIWSWGTSSHQNGNSLIIYSPSCRSKSMTCFHL